MPRPIWTGTLSFGLLNVPVSLMSAERKTDLHFRMLDARDNAPIRYERVNAETGEEVPWKEIVKAFEYEKGNYVVLQPEDIQSAAPESHETVEVETFIEANAIAPSFFEKPYFLIPGKKAEKGYVLLRETLKAAGKIGIARVVIRTREYLAAVMPQDNALVLILLRYSQELIDADEYKLPSGRPADYRITAKELQMAKQLIESMAGKWQPADYRNEFRERLHKVIEKRLKTGGLVAKESTESEEPPEGAATNVVDFMALLQKSLAAKQRTPAKKTVAKKTSKKKEKQPATKATAKKAKRRKRL